MKKKRIFAILMVLTVSLSGCSFSSHSHTDDDGSDLTSSTELNAGNDSSTSEDPSLSYSEPQEENIVFEDTAKTYYVNNVIDVTVTAGTTRTTVEQLASEISGKIVGAIELTGDYQIQIDREMTLDELNELTTDIQKHSYIENAMPETLTRASENDTSPDDYEWALEEWSADNSAGSNWGVEAINAMGAWDYYDEMATINVGLIDTMFDTSHEDLHFEQVWNNPEELTSDHGTHVSGIIGALYNNGTGICGVAPTASLYGFSITNDFTDPDNDNAMLSGTMKWKYALAKLITSGCRVVNVSMGTMLYDKNGAPVLDQNAALEASEKNASVFTPFLQKLLNQGYDFVIVQSAGNDGDKGRDAVETGIFAGISDETVKSRILIVGAAQNNTGGSYSYASFSNTGSRVDVAAPGVNIHSTVPGSSYADMNGTSMAAPHVAGIAALCYAINPDLTGDQVKNIILETARPTVTGADGTSYKMPDAAASLEASRIDTLPDQEEIHAAYIQFMQNGDWIPYHAESSMNGTSTEEYRQYLPLNGNGQAAATCFVYDMDSDGIEDLIVTAGTSIADWHATVFTWEDGNISFVGSVSNGGWAMGNTAEKGVIFRFQQGGEGQDTLVTKNGMELTVADDESYNYEHDYTDEKAAQGWTFIPEFEWAE